MSMENKVVIITGGAGGIGLAVARRFAAEKTRVALVDLHEDKAKSAAEGVKHAGAADAIGVGCDVSDEKQVEAAAKTVMERFGRIDVVVNNAGLMTFKAITDLTGDDWKRILHVDLLGAFYFTKQAFLVMKEGGAIVNVSSVHAVETEPLVAPYAAAKAALLSFTRSAALEGAPRKIRVNAILPGAVDTPMLWENPNVKAGVEKIDPNDIGKPAEIAEVIAFLAFPAASFVQGAAVRVDGGRLSRL
ncbi:oxidoreductase [Opitutaceae bacterium EW11]|nr:oxidoreductase [Opitutaceae bacterium EW11]